MIFKFDNEIIGDERFRLFYDKETKRLILSTSQITKSINMTDKAGQHIIDLTACLVKHYGVIDLDELIENNRIREANNERTRIKTRNTGFSAVDCKEKK